MRDSGRRGKMRDSTRAGRSSRPGGRRAPPALLAYGRVDIRLAVIQATVLVCVGRDMRNRSSIVAPAWCASVPRIIGARERAHRVALSLEVDQTAPDLPLSFGSCADISMRSPEVNATWRTCGFPSAPSRRRHAQRHRATAATFRLVRLYVREFVLPPFLR